MSTKQYAASLAVWQQLVLLCFPCIFLSSIHRHLNDAIRNHMLSGTASRQSHVEAIAELRCLVPPPTRHQLGGEEADDAAYARFLSVSDWDATKAAPKMKASLDWRRRMKPGLIRPHHCDVLSRQHAWLALTAGGNNRDSDATIDIYEPDGDGGSEGSNIKRAKTHNNNNKMPLDPPHTCPPFQSWRTTRHGLPITYFRCWMWRPDLASPDEIERHMAYTMHHLIRRCPKSVSRVCILFDLRGFEGWMLPYIHRGVNVLRMHYPGRAGCMCFLNVPPYFRPFWKVISPWLDDEIRSKVFFAPKEVDGVERAVAYLGGMPLKAGPTM